jgi:hypothetical protein
LPVEGCSVGYVVCHGTILRCETGALTVYVACTRVKTSDQPIENAAIVAQEMTSWLRDIDGFEGFLMLSREGSTMGLTFWESRDVAERHRVARMNFIERMTSVAGVEIEPIVDYEVTFAELGPLTVGSTS